MVEVEGTKQFSSRAVVCYVKANLLCEPPRVVAEDAGDSFSHFGGALTFLTGDFAFFFFQPSEKLLSGFYTEPSFYVALLGTNGIASKALR